MAILIPRHQGNGFQFILVSGDPYLPRRVGQLIAGRATLRICALGAELLCEPPLNRYDALLLESRLADVDGIMLYKWLKCVMTVPPTIIFAANESSIERVADAFKAGVLDYIEKPFTSQRLVNALLVAVGLA